MWLKSLLIVYVLTLVSSAPYKYKLSNKKTTYRSVEGDMLLSDKQYKWIYSETTSRNALLPDDYHWPNGIVYYKYGSEFSSGQKRLILGAMAKISEISCIRFELAPENSTHYVNILEPNVQICSTAVGYQKEVQPLKLAPPCFRSGVIQHELLHSLGFFHQQSDPNRDRYVYINFKNIKEAKKKNFKKYSAKTVGSIGTGYDYSSIMHYGRYYFTRNGRATIEPLKSGVNIGQRVGLSDKDILKLNLLYKCKNKTKKEKKAGIKGKKDTTTKSESIKKNSGNFTNLITMHPIKLKNKT